MNKKAAVFAVCAMAGAMTLGACGNTISEEISKQEKAGTRKEKKAKDSTESVSKKESDTQKASKTDKSETDKSAKTTEQTDHKKDIKINDDIYRYFGMGYDDLVAELGTPSWNSGTEDWLGRQIRYDDKKIYFTQVPNYVDQVGEVSGVLSVITNMKQSDVVQVADLAKMLGIGGDLRYYVDEGIGDYSYDEGALVAAGTNGDYLITILFNEDKSVTGTSDIFIRKMSLYPAGQNMTEDDVENEVSSIRTTYNDIEENISDQRYTIKEIEVSGKKASVYLDSENKPACVDIADSNMEGYSCKLYYKDGNLIFTYYEDPQGTSERLYFKNGNLFRWRHCEDSGDPEDAVNHDNEDSVDFKVMENNAKELSKKICQELQL